MDIEVLDATLTWTGVVDVYATLIWTDRYYGYGDFEITSGVTAQILDKLQEDRYLRMKLSEHVMIIESLAIRTNKQSGNILEVKGRSLESILERRIIWAQTILTGNLQSGIQTLLNENAINPTDADRKIAKLTFEASTDPIITALTVDAQYFGDSLYTAIQKLCQENNIGFKITLNDSGNFVFKLYAGVDRSNNQSTNPYVKFSPEFENLINSEYTEDKKSLKTVTLVAGEGEGSSKLSIAVALTDANSDLSRREMFTDASGISKTTSGGTLTDEEYLAQMIQKGAEDLWNNTFTSSFEGELDTSLMYTYGEDYFMGDIVQIANEYGHQGSCRVIEMIHSLDTSGIKAYPTFSTVV